MNAYSEDLRKKIVEAVEKGMPKIEAAKTFGVGISSVKRYVAAAREGRSLAPKKRPGIQAQARRRCQKAARGRPRGASSGDLAREARVLAAGARSGGQRLYGF
jgi:Transposase